MSVLVIRSWGNPWPYPICIIQALLDHVWVKHFRQCKRPSRGHGRPGQQNVVYRFRLSGNDPQKWPFFVGHMSCHNAILGMIAVYHGANNHGVLTDTHALSEYDIGCWEDMSPERLSSIDS